jgi:hypothetical protein
MLDPVQVLDVPGSRRDRRVTQRRIPAAWIAPPWWVGGLLLVSLLFVPLGMLVHDDFFLVYLAGLVATKTAQYSTRRRR